MLGPPDFDGLPACEVHWVGARVSASAHNRLCACVRVAQVVDPKFPDQSSSFRRNSRGNPQTRNTPRPKTLIYTTFILYSGQLAHTDHRRDSNTVLIHCPRAILSHTAAQIAPKTSSSASLPQHPPALHDDDGPQPHILVPGFPLLTAFYHSYG